jgi:hypothetical protein
MATLISGLNGSVASAATSATPNSFITPLTNPGFTSARVKSIILDNTHEYFTEFGEWSSIGTIFWEPVDKPYSGSSYDKKSYALPIFPNIKHYPLINEIIYTTQLTSTNLATNLSANRYYYFPPLNMWNSQIHNAQPGYDNDPSNDILQTNDYESSFQGEVRQIEDNSSNIFLGKTFVENASIYPLLPYEGDVIYEGRWGNSIRLGSTVKNAVIPNNWSSVGTNGDPIFILRNGQTTTTEFPWVPQLENINNDSSSIYLTSTQKISLFPASVNNFSFSKSTPPTNIGQYEGNQIILNSGRLVFNAKSDSILALANKSIQLSCNETLGVDAKQISLTADKVYLGSSEGVEGTKIQSVVLGENLNFVLGDIAIFLQTLSIAFKTSTDSNGAPIVALQTIASDAETISNDLLNIVNGRNLLSKTVKTV